MYPNINSRWSTVLEEDDETIYSRSSRERLVEEDAQTSEDDWLMEGWEEGLPQAEEEIEEDDWTSLDIKEEMYL